MINDITIIESILFFSSMIVVVFSCFTAHTQRQLWLLNLSLVPIWSTLVLRGNILGIVAFSALMVVAFIGTLLVSRGPRP